MFPIRSENISELQPHNIRISELKPNMSQPRKVIHLPKVRMLSRGRTASGVRITNVKSIKPPDPDVVKKQEEEKLRAQLQKEIVSRSRTCSYTRYECFLPVVSGKQYCSLHILQDTTAPYKQCSHVFANGHRCNMPSPVDSEHGLCYDHARSSLYAKMRSTAPPPPVTTTETLLNQLQHYVRPERTRTTSCASSVSVVSDPAEQDQVVHAVDPFKQIDATTVNAAYSSTLMECCSASDSDGDSVLIDNHSVDVDDNSDNEEAECEKKPLWRAGVFTAEEAVSEAKNALISLQSAYIRQMSRLRVLLQTARLQYLRSIKSEKEQYCSINSQSKNGPLTVRERRQLRKLKAYAGYHRKHGVDAVLARKLHRKRAKANEPGQQKPLPVQWRCSFSEGGVRCASHVLPAAKHCARHILLDAHQVLYAACGDPRGGVPCREPMPRLPLPSASCAYHCDPPHYSQFTLKKEESDSETDSHSSSDASQADVPPIDDATATDAQIEVEE